MDSVDAADHSAAKSIAKGAGLVFVGLLIGRLLGYLTRLVVARYLGPAEYGLLVLALSVFSLASVIGLAGLQSGLLRFVPEFKGKKEDKKIRPLVYYSLRISVLISAVAAFFIIIFSDQISAGFFHNPGLSTIMKIIGLSIPFGTASSILVGLMMGLKYPKYRVYLDDILKPLSRLAILLAGVLLGFGILGATFAYFLSLIISAAAGFYIFFKISARSGSKLTKFEKKELLSYSWPTMFSALIFIVMGQIDSLLLGFLKVVSDVGLYNAALPTVDIMVMMHVAGVSLFLPVISELHTRGRVEAVGEMYKKIIKWITMATFPIFIGFVLFPNQILTLLFGAEYSAAGSSLAILSIGYFVNVVLYSGNDILNLFKKTRFNLYASVFAVTLNAVLDYFLIQYYGITGAAIATSVTYAILGATIAYLAYRSSKMSPYNNKTLRVIISGLLTLTIFYIVTLFINLTIANALFLAPPILFLYLVFLVGFKCFDKEDLAVLASMEKKTGIRIGFIRKLVKASAG